MKKRSLGLTLLGWFEILMGTGGFLFASLCWIILLALIQKKMTGHGEGVNFQDFLYIILAILAAFLPLITIIIGRGILKLKKWAWRLNIFLKPIIYI